MAAANPESDSTNGSDRSTLNSSPAIIGPMIPADWNDTERNATTRSTNPGGARSIGSARLAGAVSDRATPNTTTSARIGVIEVRSLRARRKKPTPAAISMTRPTA